MRSRSLLGGGLAVVLLLALPRPAGPHDIPADVTVRAHLKAGDGTLRLLARVPLSATRDVRFPTREEGELDLERLGPELRHAGRLWIAGYVDLWEGERRLGEGTIAAARVSLPSDRSFRAGWEEALEHVTGPGPPAGTELLAEQASLDLLIEYPIRSHGSRFSVEPRLAHLGMTTETHLRWHAPDGVARDFHFAGNPGRIRLDPRWSRAVVRFLGDGVAGLLGGMEQMLLLLCMVLPFRRVREVAPLAVSFAAGTSLALAASGAGLAPGALWYPTLVSTLAAASILWAAAGNVLGATLRLRWPVALAFGLIHGAALFLPLREQLQYAGAHGGWAVGAFGLGAAAAAAAALFVAARLTEALFRRGVPERIGVILVSAVAGHEAWHWLLERAGRLGEYRLELPSTGLRLAADLAGVAMAALVAVGVIWALRELFGLLGWRRAGDARGAIGGRDAE